jgi:hypothetical protein
LFLPNGCRCTAALIHQLKDHDTRRSSLRRIYPESAEQQRPKQATNPSRRLSGTSGELYTDAHLFSAKRARHTLAIRGDRPSARRGTRAQAHPRSTLTVRPPRHRRPVQRPQAGCAANHDSLSRSKTACRTSWARQDPASKQGPNAAFAAHKPRAIASDKPLPRRRCPRLRRNHDRPCGAWPQHRASLQGLTDSNARRSCRTQGPPVLKPASRTSARPTAFQHATTTTSAPQPFGPCPTLAVASLANRQGPSDGTRGPSTACRHGGAQVPHRAR